MVEPWVGLTMLQIGLVVVVLLFVLYVNRRCSGEEAGAVTDRWIASVISAFGRVVRLLKPKRGGDG